MNLFDKIIFFPDRITLPTHVLITPHKTFSLNKIEKINSFLTELVNEQKKFSTEYIILFMNEKIDWVSLPKKSFWKLSILIIAFCIFDAI